MSLNGFHQLAPQHPARCPKCGKIKEVPAALHCDACWWELTTRDTEMDPFIEWIVNGKDHMTFAEWMDAGQPPRQRRETLEDYL